MLDVRRLRVLREVAAQGSFSAAAEALSFTQSAISQQISALEREAGTQLVERNGRGIRMTDAGQALVRHADAVMARLADAEQELAAIAGLEGGRLRLATLPSAGAVLVPQAIRLFHERHPEVELALAESEPEDSLPHLKAGEYDLALVLDYKGMPEPEDPEVERITLLEDTQHIALPKDHALAGRRRLRLADLTDESWIGGCTSCHAQLVNSCRNVGFDPKISFRSDDYAVMQGLVAAGVGVTLIPDLVLAAGINPDVVVKPLGREAPVRIIQAALPAKGYRSPATEAMIGILHEVCDNFRETFKRPVAA